MLRVSLLGGVALEFDGRALPAPSSPAASALLGWLALHPGAHSRADLHTQLWPGEEGSTIVSDALSELAEALGEDAAQQLVVTPENAQLQGPAVWVDVREFTSLADAGDLAAAAALSRDELLQGLDADWIDAARDAHRARLLAVLEGLAEQAEAAGDLEAAARWTREQTALDPLSEERHRALITRLHAVGDRAGAIAAYERLRERLRSDLRIKPSPETRALVERLGRE